MTSIKWHTDEFGGFHANLGRGWAHIDQEPSGFFTLRMDFGQQGETHMGLRMKESKSLAEENLLKDYNQQKE